MTTTTDTPRDIYYGGQAVIEGVMIRGPRHMAVAVRHPKGHIVRHSEELRGLYTGRLRKVPLLRGVVILWETLALGMRALSYSSRISLEEEDDDGEPVPFPEKAFWGTVVIALVFVVAIFFAGPLLLANLLERADLHRFWIVLVEAIIRLGMFVGYVAVIGLLPDIRRVFQYHGAEHMTIHAYEHGEPLAIPAIRQHPKEHTRCGTSFLLVVVMVALLSFLVFDLLVDEGLIVRTASRIFLIPVIAGISYEILRFGARFEGRWFIDVLFAPNLWLQALTTRVPDDSQIEVAVAAFESTLEAAGGEQPAAIAGTDIALD
ncbi:MAG: DUF1385 domain-containing protein [Dehalococcoidia bacterium]